MYRLLRILILMLLITAALVLIFGCSNGEALQHKSNVVAERQAKGPNKDPPPWVQFYWEGLQRTNREYTDGFILVWRDYNARWKRMRNDMNDFYDPNERNER